MQVQEDRLPMAGALPRAPGPRERVLPPQQDRRGADGDPGRDGPEPPQGHAALQQHLRPTLLREDRLHGYAQGGLHGVRSGRASQACSGRASPVAAAMFEWKVNIETSRIQVGPKTLGIEPRTFRMGL